MRLKLTIMVLVLFLISTTSLVQAHNNGDGHVEYKPQYIECEGKQINSLRLLIMRIFQRKMYLECMRDGTITLQPNLTSHLTPKPAGTFINTPSASTAPSYKPSSTPKPTLPLPTTLLETNSSPSPTPQSTTTTNKSTPSPYWHPPGSHDGLNIHEHGDQPPAWATDFSQKNFGHPIMYGGDEATPNENILKHQAYKGFTMKASGVDLYIRYHNMSNPHDRSGIFHSYEIYAKDNSNNISFWQGWEFVGDPQDRSQRATRRNEEPGHDATNGIDWPGRDQYIVSAPDLVDWKNYLRCEQWYKFGGEWAWDMSVTICGATTFYSVDEHLTDVANPSTWKLTGDVGGSRRIEISHYGPQNPIVTGLNLPTDKWYCVKKQPNYTFTGLHSRPSWDIGTTVNSPNDCPTGYLPQYLASTFPQKGVYFETGNTEEKDFPTPGVTVPN